MENTALYKFAQSMPGGGPAPAQRGGQMPPPINPQGAAPVGSSPSMPPRPAVLPHGGQGGAMPPGPGQQIVRPGVNPAHQVTPPAPQQQAQDPYAAARWRNEHPWLFGGGQQQAPVPAAPAAIAPAPGQMAQGAPMPPPGMVGRPGIGRSPFA